MLRILMLFWALLALPVLAQQEMEIIPLRHQTVDQVLPALQPLVEPGGTLSGMNNQLFLRASHRNREDIKRALAAIDAPSRRLVIHVSQNRGMDESNRGGNVSGQAVFGTQRRAEVNASIWDTRSARSESGSQMVQTIEGGRALIQIGRSVPVPMRQLMVGPGGAVATDTVVYRDIGQGFYAEPHLNGDRVTLEISQQGDTAGRYGPGSASTQRLTTTVSGRLGDWIELGGAGTQAVGGTRGGFGASTGEVRDSRSIWLMVEEIR
jgi:type II secretory pathway component GspD/PulD (secretin)